MPVISFEKMGITLHDAALDELSTDNQRYLYEMCTGISNGNILLSLSRKDPGNINHSGWLTTANRIFILYVSTKNPSGKLKVLTE